MTTIASDPPGSSTENKFTSRDLLASRWHTLLFLAVLIAVSVVSAFNAVHGSQVGAPESTSHILQIYVWLIFLEWLWVRFVYKGMRDQGRSIREFFGDPWFTPRLAAADLVYVLLLLGFSYVWFISVPHLFSHAEDGSNPLLPGIPSGPAAVLIWIALSLSAGICEEIVFRGYLQRQLTALSGSPVLAILGQAVVFGVAHGYEGVGAVVRIVVFGIVFGAVAQWRGNIRAGIVAHAIWDIVEGLGLV